jgi:pyruvate dehydrogenase E2 component (dihydrolipoamide acetyltransferase)
MAEKILMPRLSDTMTEGVIAAWHKNVGDSVKKGEILADIETDKATMELESYKEGTLLYQGAKEGEKIAVNDLLAIIGNKGEDINALINEAPKQPAETVSTPSTQPAQTQEQPQPQAQPQNENTQANTQPTTANKDYASMEEVVLMPRLSDTMTEGVIAAWHKNVGDSVKKGEILADIETDKATMELESYKEGTLLYQGAKEGEKIAVNDLLAIIGNKNINVEEIVNGIRKSHESTQLATPSAQTTEDKQKAEGETTTAAASVAQAAQQATTTQTTTQFTATAEQSNGKRIFASPLAKKLAQEKGIDLKQVKGSGDNGRIVKADVDNFKPTAAQQPTAQPAIAAMQESFEEVPISQMRKTIARRLAESKFTAPHFYLTVSINMDAAVAARQKMNELSPVKISFNDIVLKAVAVALKQHPKVNSSWRGETIRINHHVNIGVAVAVEEGLLVPVVRFADTKSLSQIAAEVKTFAEKAKNKKLQPSDWEGSTFTISNLGMFGIEEFTAIINPPDACILAIGGIEKIPVVKNDTIVPANVMKVTLSCDHRVVDGATGAAFLQTVKSLLEEPLRLLI